ncbi:MAG: sulfatase, partial [Thermoanaerobaculia bacterium]
MARPEGTLKDDLKWSLAAGAILGAIDGAHSVFLGSTVAGPLASRVMNIVIATVVDTTCLVLVSLCVGAISVRLRGRTARSVAVFGLFLLAGLFAVENADARASLPVPMPIGLGVALIGALAASSGYWVSCKIRAGRLRSILAAAAIAAVLVSLGSTSRPAEGTDGGAPGMILISLDTLRADHLGCYGYERDTSPNLDKLAASGCLFTTASAPSNWTLPSHASMLTGLDPITHGALDFDAVLEAELPTLAEGLSEEGFRTAAFVGTGPYGFVGSERGLSRGFDEYRHRFFAPPGWYGAVASGVQKLYWRFFAHRIGNGTAQVDQMVNWLWRFGDEPHFVFLHLFDVHSDRHRLPYESPSPFNDLFRDHDRSAYTGCDGGLCASELLGAYAGGEVPPPDDPAVIQHMRDLYDGGIAYTDHELGRLFQAIRDLGQWDNTTIVVTADHGEAFFEHGVPLHKDLHTENVGVPLIVSVPDEEPRRVEHPVHVKDVAALFLELATGHPSSASSLLAWVRGEAANGGKDVVFNCNKRQVAVRLGTWRLIRAHGEDQAMG